MARTIHMCIDVRGFLANRYGLSDRDLVLRFLGINRGRLEAAIATQARLEAELDQVLEDSRGFLGEIEDLAAAGKLAPLAAPAPRRLTYRNSTVFTCGHTVTTLDDGTCRNTQRSRGLCPHCEASASNLARRMA